MYTLAECRHRPPVCRREKFRLPSLKGHLGEIKKATHEVGVALEPAAGRLFAEFEVLEGAAFERVGQGSATEGSFYEENGETGGHDAVISPITPINQMTHTFTQNYRVEVLEHYPCKPASCSPILNENDSAPINVPSNFEGGPLAALEFQQEHPSSEPVFSWRGRRRARKSPTSTRWKETLRSKANGAYARVGFA